MISLELITISVILTFLEASIVTVPHRKSTDQTLSHLSRDIAKSTLFESPTSGPHTDPNLEDIEDPSSSASKIADVQPKSDSQHGANVSSAPDEAEKKTATSPYREIIKIIQDEANITTGNTLTYQETFQAILGIRWDRVLKRAVRRERLDFLFPKPSNLSLSCYQDLMAFVDGLVGEDDGAEGFVSKEWALQMLDSYGKPSAGLLNGVFQWVGNYDECLTTQAKTESPNSPLEFSGKYCRVLLDIGRIVKVSFPANINKFWLQERTFPVVVNWGVCVPNSCNAADVVAFLTKGTMAALRLPVQKAICFGGARFSEDSGAVATVVILCIFVAVVTICTLLDVYYYRPWMTNDDWKKDDKVKDKEVPADDLELKHGIGECRKRSDISSSLSSTRGDTDVTAAEQTGPVKQTTIKGVDSGNKKTTFLTTVDSATQNGSISWQALDNKVRSVQSQTEVEVPQGFTGNQENGNLETGLRDIMEPDRSVKSTQKVIGVQLIQGMSLYRNMCSLVRKSRSQGTFDCIQGMRVITLAWIVVGHCYTYGGMLDESNLIFGNSAELVETSARLSFHIVGSAHLAVDTFFVISGCLSMLVTLRLLRRNKPGLKFWSQFLLHRFWRLTPLYMVVMMVGTMLYDHVVQGPLKSDKLAEFEQCRSKWWAHLLYINNFYRPHSKCMTWSWFMAVDMQLFLMSPFFIYTIHRNLKVGIVLILCLLVFGLTSAFVSEYVHGGQFVLMDLSFQDYWSYVYTMPWARASVFAIGLLLGVILYKQVGRPVISKRNAFCIWTAVAFVSIFLILINHNQWQHGSQNWTRIQQSFYESLVRPAWASCIAWVIYACCSDLGGYANTILGWRPFLVLSRLTYSLYLLHPMVIMFVVYSRRSTIYLDPANLSLVYNYIGNLTISFLLSALFSLIFEMPLAAMENVLWRGL